MAQYTNDEFYPSHPIVAKLVFDIHKIKMASTRCKQGLTFFSIRAKIITGTENRELTR